MQFCKLRRARYNLTLQLNHKISVRFYCCGQIGSNFAILFWHPVCDFCRLICAWRFNSCFGNHLCLQAIHQSWVLSFFTFYFLDERIQRLIKSRFHVLNGNYVMGAATPMLIPMSPASASWRNLRAAPSLLVNKHAMLPDCPVLILLTPHSSTGSQTFPHRQAATGCYLHAQYSIHRHTRFDAAE